MTGGKVAGYFLDTCVLLPQSLDATYEACSGFLDQQKKCFISPSVKNEVFELSKQCYSVISTTIRYYLKPALERNGIKELTNKDGRVIAKVFGEQKKRIIKEFPTKSNIRGELIGVIENYIAKEIHNLKDENSLPIDALLASTLTELEKAKYEIEKPFKKVEEIPVYPHDKLLNLPSLKSVVSNHNMKDVTNLASAITYQFQTNEWVIFVTNDEKEIINNEKDIWEIFALQCTKPSWALDYYREITKLGSPIEYYRGLLIPNQKQKEFGNLFEQLYGIRILRKPFT